MRFSRSARATSHASPSFPDAPRLRPMCHFCGMTTRTLMVGWGLLASMGLNAQSDSEVSNPKGGGYDPAVYALVVTTEPAHQPGLTRHLISVRLPEGDRVSSVYGTNLHPLFVRAPEGVFNSPYNGSWSASGMNPKFFEIMPDMADDTFATIGLTTGAKISGIEGAEDPTMVQDPGAPWDTFFTETGETHLNIDTHTGGAFFVLRTAANGAPVDGEVFLMQVTTAGELSGALNLQIFPSSEAYDQVRARFEFNGKGEYPGMAIE